MYKNVLGLWVSQNVFKEELGNYTSRVFNLIKYDTIL